MAVARGARVLQTPRRGLGRAYIDAIPYVRGKYVLMGDADCTYDFRELAGFVEKFREGCEFVMGSRFRGYIEPGSMPALHRYFGTPVTTAILNLLYSSKFTDIHCGMRGITRESLRRMGLRSQSWEYASEMVLKSVHMRLRTTEVPVRFLKDRDGRLSHHRRRGWFSPWAAAWINLKAMFVYGADFFLLKPGAVFVALGLLLTLPLSFGPLTLGPITFSFYWMLLGVTLVVLGLQCLFLGVIAQVLYDFASLAGKKWLGIFRYTRTVVISAVFLLAGAGMGVPLVFRYVQNGFTLSDGLNWTNYLAVTGLQAMIASFMLFTFTLILHAVSLRLQPETSPPV